MTEEQIIEGNVLIAVFMGIPALPKIGGYRCFEYEEDNIRTDIDLHYQDSWEWLMPVVERIESINNGAYDIAITTGWTRIFRNEDELTISESYYSETKLIGIYTCVLQFIKWYNEGSN